MQRAKNGMIGSGASLDDIRLFVALAEAGSFAEAASRTGMAPSTLSRRIGAFEEALGLSLVHRTTRRFALTAEGERLVSRAREPIHSLAELVSEPVDDEPSGRLRVTAMLATGAEIIAPLLMEFAKRHPRVIVDLNLTNAVVPIIEERIDIAFRSAPLTEGDWIARRIATWPYALAAAPGVTKARLTIDELAGVAAVLTRADAPWSFLAKNGERRVIQPAPRFVANDPRVALEAAAAGLGVVAAPEDRISEYGKRLTRITVPGHELVARELYAVQPSRRLVPARVRLALDFVAARLSAGKTRAASLP